MIRVVWTVPATGTYVIEASGASGASCTDADSISPFPWKRGGLGTKITGAFPFIQGTQLKVLLSQEGGTTTEFLSRPGGEKVEGVLSLS